MTVLDLQALTDDVINDLGLDSNSLWLVKIAKKVYGPFETGALKLHSGKFPEQFDEAHASPMMSPSWQPFFSIPQFQRRTPEILNSSVDWEKCHYHTLLRGVKDGPYSLVELEALWQSKDLHLTDLISWDDGHQWTKFYLHPHFDRRSRETIGLPGLPIESSFTRSEAEMSEKWEDTETRTTVSESLASLAYINLHADHKTTLKVEEISFHPPKTDEQNFQYEKRKKITMSAFAFVLVGAIGSWVMLTSDNSSNSDIAMENSEHIPHKQIVRPEANNNWKTTRAPASVPPTMHGNIPRPRPEMNTPSYNAPEVYRESHSNYQEPAVPEPYGEVEAPIMPEEHSLVQGNHNLDQGLDGAFNGEEGAIPEPVPMVEEVSDF